MKQTWARPGRLATLACLVVAGGTAAAPAAAAVEPARFCDTAGHPQEASIEQVAEAGIAQGGTDGCFRPDAAVTRGQLATFLQRAYGLPESSGTFCDTAGHPHEPGIRAVAAAGIAQGRSDGCYRPDAAVTRGQTAAFLARAEQLPAQIGGGFCDTAGHVHEGAIGAVVAAGITQGYADGCFRPDTPVTRGQMAAFLTGVLPGGVAPAPAPTAVAPAPTVVSPAPTAPASPTPSAPSSSELAAVPLPPPEAPAQTGAAEYETRLFLAVNAERLSRGLPALSRNGCADQPARSHAQRMAEQDQMYHQDLGAVLAGCNAGRAAENVGNGDVTAEQMVQLWMGSPSHRAALLDPALTSLGSGAAQRSDGRWYASHVFLGG